LLLKERGLYSLQSFPQGENDSSEQVAKGSIDSEKWLLRRLFFTFLYLIGCLK